MRRPRTLFAKTAVTLTIAIALFLLFSVAIMVNFLLVPLAKQGADDLAALMVLATQTWVEIPPATRPFLEQELMDEYQLKLSIDAAPAARSTRLLPFLRFLEQALSERVGQPIVVGSRSEETIWFCADIPMGGRTIRVSFPSERIGARPPTASLLLITAGAVVILLTTLLLVQRLTRPLARLSDATSRLGRGEALEPLPETGPRELVTLTRKFNHMAKEIADLLANRTILFAGISHDLRTPITRMRIALEMLPTETDPKLIDRLRRDLQQMDQLISNTLELARGLGHREAEEVDLREFVDGVIADYRHSDSAIDWKPGAACLRVLDTLALGRVLSNLIDNALRYGAGKPVKVSCDCDGKNAYISVQDEGPGIPEAEREAVFRPFHRLDASRNPATGGSGLGLAIAAQLCAAHGWELKLLPREGGGTDARIRIPSLTSLS